MTTVIMFSRQNDAGSLVSNTQYREYPASSSYNLKLSDVIVKNKSTAIFRGLYSDRPEK